MAAAGFASPGGFHPQEPLQQQLGCGSFCRPSPKEFQSLSQGHAKQNISISGFPHVKPSELVDPWKYKDWLSEYDPLSRPVPTFNKPELIDVQDARPESVLLSSGISEKCSQHGKIMQSLQSGSSMSEGESLSMPLISDRMGFKSLETDFCHQSDWGDYLQPSLVYPEAEVLLPQPTLDCFEDLPCISTMRILPDSRVLFMGTEAEIIHLGSVDGELSRNGARSNMSSMGAHIQTVTPVQRPDTAKVKASPSKKEIRRAAKERDMYRKNLFHACESLLFVILDKNKGRMALLSLMKSAPEVSHLLMQVSASITGAALAVLFSVVWKVAFSRVPFCSTKLLNTGLALGLVWLSAAVNSLRDNVVIFSRNSSRIGWTDTEMPRRVESSVNQIFFRALTLMAMAMLSAS
ncbi:unnamed protein product [Spirodela intermedia]|uniref:Uncharacterized protein n=1 Tax=Spirodela intermedia TaxID=51605 RepID=A0A7I8JFP8_SPIIN|nr:unnamed protein product [Spirodela intermedia]CAA6669008.1 unnamed protein product [Spirodela intermedia]